MGSAKITLRDVAERAGVAISTVSLVLNNKALDGNVQISDATIRKVRQAAQELGYLTARQPVIGLILTWFREATEIPMVHGIIEGLRQGENYHLAMSLTTKARPQAELKELEIAASKRLDGVILEPSFALWQRLATEPDLVARCNNLVLINRRSLPQIPSVTINHEQCGYLAGRYLMDMGHRDTAFLEGHTEPVPASYRPASERQIVRERLAGLRRALAAEGRDCIKVKSIRQLLARREQLTAVYCAHTRGSTALLNECWHQGVAVPEQLSIVGQDEEFAKEIARPSLTRVDARAEEVGALAAELVMQRVRGHTPESVVLEPRLVERASVLAR